MNQADGGPWPEWKRHTRRPELLLPTGSWDCAPHLYGDPLVFPVCSTRYPPIKADLADLLRMHRTIGISRGVLVQPILYGTDHGVLLDALAQVGDRYRGTAIVDDTLSDAGLDQLHAAGFRNARFNFYSLLGIQLDPGTFKRSIARIAEFGWSATIHVTGADLLRHEAMLRKISVPVVIDHLGHFDIAAGLGQPAFHLMIDLLKNHGWWIKLSNGDRISLAGHPFDDVVEYAQHLIEAAPDRTIWGTDWPHPMYSGTMPNDADLVDLLHRFAPNEEEFRRILVENPARLFGAAG
jgi:predicted TIM-barrel fold metal-dependent hydrolase